MKNCGNKNCTQQNPQVFEAFSLQKDKKDGRRSWCKVCVNLQGRGRIKTEEEKERSRIRTARHRIKHAERLKAELEEKKKNPIFKEKACRATAKYREFNPEKILAQNERVKTDPEVKKRANKASAKYKDKDPEAYRRRQNERNAIPENREKRRKSSSKSNKKNPGVGRARRMKRHAAQLNRFPKWLSEKDQEAILLIYKECAFLQSLAKPEDPFQVDHIIPIQGLEVSGLHVPWNLQILPRSLNIRKGNKLLKAGSKLHNECEEFKIFLDKARLELILTKN